MTHATTVIVWYLTCAQSSSAVSTQRSTSAAWQLAPLLDHRAQFRGDCKVLELELRFAYAERDLLNVLGQVELRKLLEELLSRLLTEPLLDLL